MANPSGVKRFCFAIKAVSSLFTFAVTFTALYISLEEYIRVNSTSCSAESVSKWSTKALTYLSALLLKIPAYFIKVIVSRSACVSLCTSLNESSLSCLTIRQNLASSISKDSPKVNKICASSFVDTFSLA